MICGMDVTVRILGPVEAEHLAPGRSGLGPKPALLFGLLAARRGSVVSTDRLCDALWGDQQPDSALATLQSHISRARRAVEPAGSIVAVDCGYRLDLPDGALDLDEFERSVRLATGAADDGVAAHEYALALGWWRGSAYGDLADAEGIRDEALRLDERRLTVTEEWIDRRLAAGGDPSLVGDLEGLAAAHPLRERFQRQRMVALHRDGRQAEALRRAGEFRAMLRDEMGLAPSPLFRTTETQILTGDEAVARPGGDRRRARRRPVIDDPTRLVGRACDLARIAGTLGEGSLVTLVGPGGVGKTRLARRAAAVIDGFADPTAFIELASVDDPATLPGAVATALEVQQRQHLTIEESLLAALASRRQLIVLDNCEHLLDALVPFVDRLRARCPGVKVLATSREPLGLPGEVVLPVPPLTVSPPGTEDPDEIAGADAVQLLVDRVHAAVPDFAVTGDNATTIAEICRRLDGLPLAIELVAARFRSLDPATILQRLGVPSVLLDASMRSANPRHRTLRDTIAWSFAHLEPAEQGLFARLSTFVGSFDLAAVEAVCGGVDDPGGSGVPVDHIEVLAALVDKSMVQRVGGSGSRYHLLETLREYAREVLHDRSNTGDLRAAHVTWFTSLAEQASIGLTGPDEAAWSQRVEADFDNFRAALLEAVRTADADSALRLVCGLREFAFRRIRYELCAWAELCIDLEGASAHLRYPLAVAIVSYGRHVRGDFAGSIETGLRAIDLSTDGRDTSGLAERAIGNALGYLGRFDEALQWMDRIVTSGRHGSPSRLAHALYMRSVAETSVGRTVRAAVLAGEAQAAAAASGSPTAKAQAAYALGLALEGTEPDESLRLLRRSAAMAGAAGNRWIEAFAQTEVWWLEARNGDARSGLAGAARVIDTWYDGGDFANLQLSLRRVFGLLVQLGDHHHAAMLHGALIASGATAALPFEPRDAEHFASAVVGLRATLGDQAFDEAVATGAALSVGDVAALVHERVAVLSS